MLLSISHTLYAHTLTHGALIKGAFLCFNRKKPKTKQKRGVFKKLRRKSDLVLKFSPSAFGSFSLLIPFSPFGQLICSASLIKVEVKSV